MQPIQGRLVCAKIGFGLRGFWRVLAGHIVHARLTNRMIYWLRQSSPICLAQSSAIIPRPDEISGLDFLNSDALLYAMALILCRDSTSVQTIICNEVHEQCAYRASIASCRRWIS